MSRIQPGVASAWLSENAQALTFATVDGPKFQAACAAAVFIALCVSVVIGGWFAFRHRQPATGTGMLLATVDTRASTNVQPDLMHLRIQEKDNFILGGVTNDSPTYMRQADRVIENPWTLRLSEVRMGCEDRYTPRRVVTGGRVVTVEQPVGPLGMHVLARIGPDRPSRDHAA